MEHMTHINHILTKATEKKECDLDKERINNAIKLYKKSYNSKHKQEVIVKTVQYWAPFLHKNAKYARINVNELIAPAIQGVVNAIRKFDPTLAKRSNTQFTSYAFNWVRKYIDNALMTEISSLTYPNIDVYNYRRKKTYLCKCCGEKHDKKPAKCQKCGATADEIGETRMPQYEEIAVHEGIKDEQQLEKLMLLKIELERFINSVPLKAKERQYINALKNYGDREAMKMMKMKDSDVYDMKKRIKRRIAANLKLFKGGILGAAILLMLGVFCNVKSLSADDSTIRPIKSYSSQNNVDPNAPWFDYDPKKDVIICKGKLPAVDLVIVQPKYKPLKDKVQPGDELSVPVSGSFVLKYKYFDSVYGMKEITTAEYTREARTVFTPPQFKIEKKNGEYYLIGTCDRKMMVDYINERTDTAGNIVDRSEVVVLGLNQAEGYKIEFKLYPSEGKIWPNRLLKAKIMYHIDDPELGKIDKTVDIMFKPENELIPKTTAPAMLSTSGDDTAQDGKVKDKSTRMKNTLIAVLAIFTVGYYVYKWRKKKAESKEILGLEQSVDENEEISASGQKVQIEEDAGNKKKPVLGKEPADPEDPSEPPEEPKEEPSYCPFEFWVGRYIKQSDSVIEDAFAIDDSRGWKWYLFSFPARQGGVVWKFRKEKEGDHNLAKIPPELEGSLVIGWNAYQNMPIVINTKTRGRDKKHYMFKHPRKGELYAHIIEKDKKILVIELREGKDGSYYRLPPGYSIKTDEAGEPVYDSTDFPSAEKNIKAIESAAKNEGKETFSKEDMNIINNEEL